MLHMELNNRHHHSSIRIEPPPSAPPLSLPSSSEEESSPASTSSSSSPLSLAELVEKKLNISTKTGDTNNNNVTTTSTTGSKSSSPTIPIKGASASHQHNKSTLISVIPNMASSLPVTSLLSTAKGGVRHQNNKSFNNNNINKDSIQQLSMSLGTNDGVSLLDMCEEEVKEAQCHRRLRKAMSVCEGRISNKVIKKDTSVAAFPQQQQQPGQEDLAAALISSSLAVSPPDTSALTEAASIEAVVTKKEEEVAESVASKKVVRFADALGLDLVSVKMIMNPESPPLIPKKILKCLQRSSHNFNSDDDDDDTDDDDFDNDDDDQQRTITSAEGRNALFGYQNRPNTLAAKHRGVSGQSFSYHHDPNSFTVGNNLRYTWKCLFEQPGLRPDFYRRLHESKVSLESVYTRYMCVNGVVRVMNVSFHKRVFVRYTLDEWRTYRDLECQYLANSNDVHTDRFTFALALDTDQVMKLTDESAAKRPSSSSSSFVLPTPPPQLADASPFRYRPTPFVQPAASGMRAYTSSHEPPCFSIHFAVCFETRDQDNAATTTSYWDNNGGANYTYECNFKILSPNGSIVGSTNQLEQQQQQQPIFAQMFDDSTTNAFFS